LDHYTNSRANYDDTITTNDTANAILTPEEPGDFFTLCTIANLDLVCHTRALKLSAPQADSIYQDTGATTHVFHNRSLFSNYRPFTSALTVKGFDSNASGSAVGLGNIQIRSYYKGKPTSIFTLSDVLHVPNARCNLLSQTKIDPKGVHSHTGDGMITLSRKGKIFVDGYIDNGLYKLNVEVIPLLHPTKHALSTSSTMDKVIDVLNTNIDKSGFYTT
jgi:hypothetical protein